MSINNRWINGGRFIKRNIKNQILLHLLNVANTVKSNYAKLKKADERRAHTVWFRFDNTLGNVNSCTEREHIIIVWNTKRIRKEGLQGDTRKLLKDDGCIHYLDCVDGFMNICICQNLSNSVLNMFILL